MEATLKSAPSACVTFSRDRYGALQFGATSGAARTKLHRAWLGVKDVIADLERGDADEHRAAAWTTGIDWDRKRNRGQAINTDIYGVDIVDGQILGVVQVRQFTRHKYGCDVHKSWFLVGRNEGTHAPFAHPVSGRLVQNALKRNESVVWPVTEARAWIFEVSPAKLDSILRHGDVAAVPVKHPPVGERRVLWTELCGCQVVDAHYLIAEEAIEVHDRTYARGVLLTHSKQQHADVAGEIDKWYRIQVGLRASFHAFSRPTSD